MGDVPGQLKRRGKRGGKRVCFHTLNVSLSWDNMVAYLEEEVRPTMACGSIPVVAVQEHGPAGAWLGEKGCLLFAQWLEGAWGFGQCH